MSVTLLEVWRAARTRSVALAGESAGYLVLAACEELASLPRRVRLESLELQVDGGLRIGARESTLTEQAELDLREILFQLLSVASSAGPALIRAASPAQHAQCGGLGTELEKALIPVNRAAARRALVRLYRETSRAIQTGRLAPSLPMSAPLPDESVRLPRVEEAAPKSDCSEVPQAPLASSPNPQQREFEALTRPETIVAKGRASYRSTPPASLSQPGSAATDTPKLGSVEVLAAAPDAVLFDNLPRTEDLTERMPEIRDNFDTDIAELAGPQDFVDVSEDSESPLEASTADDAAPLDPDSDGRHREEVERRITDDELEPLELVPAVESLESETPTPLLAIPIVEQVPAPSPEPELVPYQGLPSEQSDVGTLLEGFQVARPTSEVDLRRELSALAGVDLTPGSSSEVRPR